jgi:hypothetical protein
MLVYDGCANPDITVYIQGDCEALSNGCASTADFNVALSFFDFGNATSRFAKFEDVTDVVDGVWVTPTGFLWSNYETQEITGGWEFSPITHRKGASAGEVDTIKSRDFWLGDEMKSNIGITEAVDTTDGEAANLYLVSAIDMAATSVSVGFVFCFSYTDAVLASADSFSNDDEEIMVDTTASSLLALCDLGCYPTNCEGSDELEASNVVQAKDEDIENGELYVTTIVTNWDEVTPITAGAGGSSHSVCHNWGAVCNPAAMSAPSLLGVALFALFAGRF